MKKIYILFFLTNCFINTNAQIKEYLFSQNISNYLEISGGTILGNALTDDEYFIDPSNSLGGIQSEGPGFDIGFDFKIYNAVYNRFGINTNGWISLGHSSLTPIVNMHTTEMFSPLKGLSNATGIHQIKIAALAIDIHAGPNSELSYSTIGNAPNRVLIIQWKNYLYDGSPNRIVNFQIKLNETTNIIEYNYGYFNTSSPGRYAQVGISGFSKTDFNLRKTTTSWLMTESGNNNSDNCLLITNYKPQLGLQFFFTPPVCFMPYYMSYLPLTGDTSVNIQWNELSEHMYHELKLSWTGNASIGDLITPVSGSSYILSPLQPMFDYEISLRSVCSLDTSKWTENMPISTYYTIDTVPFLETFENRPASWKFVNDNPNNWKVGKQTSLSGNSACYVTTFSDTLYEYNTSWQSISYIYKDIYFPDIYNYFSMSFYWKNRGENNDYLKVFLTDLSIEPQPSTPLTNHIFSFGPFSGSDKWNKFSTNLPSNIETGKTYRLIFMWHNDFGYGFQPPASIDNIMLYGGHCDAPQNISVVNASDSTIEISWNQNNMINEWIVEYGPRYFIPGNGDTVHVFSNSAILHSLNSGTQYDIYVQSVCNSGGISIYSDVCGASTLCESYPTPLLENFQLVATPELPDCWIPMKIPKTSNAQIVTAGTSEKSLVMRSNSNPNTHLYFISPPIGSNLAECILRFSLNTNSQSLIVGTMSNPYDVSTFQPLDTMDSSNSLKFTISLAGSLPFNKHIAFYTLTQGVNGNIRIDNILLENINECVKVSDVISDSTAHNQTKIIWSPLGYETNWDILYGDNGFNISTEGNLISDVSNPHTLTGLSENNFYDVYVRASCDTINSFWSDVHSFQTNCNETALPIYENFDDINTALLTKCWSFVKNNPAHGSCVIQVLAGYKSTPCLIINGNINHLDTSRIVIAYAPKLNQDYQSLRIRLYGRNAKFVVGTNSRNDRNSGFLPIDTITMTSTFDDYDIIISNIPPGHRYVGFAPYTDNQNALNSVYMDNIRIDTLNSCPTPQIVETYSIGADSMQVVWNSNPAVDFWTVAYDQYGFNPEISGTFFTTLDSSYSIHASSFNTCYEVYVQAVCATEKSAWSLPEYLCTTCSAFELPLLESFDYPCNSHCWTKITENASVNAGMKASSYNYSPPLSIEMNSGYIENSTIIFASPEINFNLNETYIHFAARYISSNPSILIGTMEDVNNSTSFLQFDSIRLLNNWNTYCVKPENVPPSHKHIAFKLASPNNNHRIAIDNIFIDTIGGCSPPINFRVIDYNEQTIKLQWDKTGTETQWEIAYSARGSASSAIDYNFHPDDGTGIHITNIDSTEYLLTGLETFTTFKIYVRADCSSEKSMWSTHVIGKTNCDIETLPFFESFESPSYSWNCWRFVNLDNDPSLFNTWRFASFINHTPNGYRSLYHDSYPPMPQDAMAISAKKIIPTDTPVKLTFYSYIPNTANNFNLKLFIQNTGMFIDTLLFNEIWSPSNPSQSWEKVEIDLSPFAGDTISLVFRYEGQNASAWYIDDITIEQLREPEINPQSQIFFIDQPQVVGFQLKYNSTDSVNSVSIAPFWELTKDVEYIIQNDSIYFNAAFLASILLEDNDAAVFKINFSPNYHLYATVIAKNNFIHPYISPSVGSYLLNNPSDISSNIILNDAIDIIQIIDNQTTPYELISGIDYEFFTTGLLTINNSYLQNILFNHGQLIKLNISFVLGNPIEFHIFGIDYTGQSNIEISNIIIYPNPASEFISIISPVNMNVTIFDLQGKLSIKTDIISGKNNIDISSLKQGIYYIQLQNTTNIHAFKFIKL